MSGESLIPSLVILGVSTSAALAAGTTSTSRKPATAPYAKAVPAKRHDLDDEGNETKTDYMRMMKIVLDAEYHGYVGIEYEGSTLSEHDGIIATRKLLERVRDELA